MNTVRAIISLGLFGWLGYAVWTEQFSGGNSSKSRALNGVIEALTSRFGTQETAIFLFAAGILLAFFFMILQARAQSR